MIESRTIAAVAAQWQAELDASLETGETPVFYLGQGQGILGELAGPIALQWLDEQRRDTRMPLAAGGGASPFWLAPLFHQRTTDTPLLSPAIVVCYTGPDPATHAAALNTLDTRQPRFRRRPADLPPGFQPTFVPHLQPGPFVAESLPMLLAATDTTSENTGVAGERDTWVAWSAAVVAVALLLLALVA